MTATVPRHYVPLFDEDCGSWLVIESYSGESALRCATKEEAQSAANALNADVRAQRAASEEVER